MLKTITAIALGKAIFFLSRTFGMGGGNAAPGLYALKIDPYLVKNLINSKAKNIIITGTNGKTTTSKLISHFLKTSTNTVIRNSSGSNLERGIASYLTRHANVFGRVNYDFGVWELDEFAFNSVAPKIKPDVIIMLNAFRDQLDRYGEVDKVITRWKETLSKLGENTVLIINSDDGNLLKAAKDFRGKVIKIGVKENKITGESKTSNKPDYEAEILSSSNLEETAVRVKVNHDSWDFKLPLPGVFNVYNFLASFTLSYILNLDPGKIQESLKDFKTSFGRFEKFEINGKLGNIFLIKNPVGTTQVLQTILPHISNKDTLLLALNDNFADGTDVSWIWDINLENTKFQMPNSKCQIYVSGIRAYDMALRLKYAGVENLEIEQDLEAAFNKTVKETEGKLFILPTYTALMELQKILVKKGVKKEYWKE